MSFLDKLLCATAAIFTLPGVVCLAVLEGERSNPNLPGLILLVPASLPGGLCLFQASMAGGWWRPASQSPR